MKNIDILTIKESDPKKKELIDCSVISISLAKYPFAPYSGFKYDEIINTLINSELFNDKEIEYLKNYFKTIIKSING